MTTCEAEKTFFVTDSDGVRLHELTVKCAGHVEDDADHMYLIDIKIFIS